MSVTTKRISVPVPRSISFGDKSVSSDVSDLSRPRGIRTTASAEDDYDKYCIGKERKEGLHEGAARETRRLRFKKERLAASMKLRKLERTGQTSDAKILQKKSEQSKGKNTSSKAGSGYSKKKQEKPQIIVGQSSQKPPPSRSRGRSRSAGRRIRQAFNGKRNASVSKQQIQPQAIDNNLFSLEDRSLSTIVSVTTASTTKSSQQDSQEDDVSNGMVREQTAPPPPPRKKQSTSPEQSKSVCTAASSASTTNKDRDASQVTNKKRKESRKYKSGSSAGSSKTASTKMSSTKKTSTKRDSQTNAEKRPKSTTTVPSFFDEKQSRSPTNQRTNSRSDESDTEDMNLKIRVSTQDCPNVHSFTIGTAQIEKKEMEMKDAAKEAGIGSDQWSESLLFCRLNAAKWKQRAQLRSNSHETSVDDSREIVVEIPEEMSQAAEQAGRLLEHFYKRDEVRVADDLVGKDLRKILEFFSIIHRPKQMVFGSFGSYIQSKIWNDYYGHRDALVGYIVNVCARKAKIRHSFVTTPETSADEVYYFKGKKCEIFDGGLELQGEAELSCSVVHRIFNGDDDEDVVDVDDTIANELRKDFCTFLKRSLTGSKVTFDACNVSVKTKAASTQTREDQMAVLVIDFSKGTRICSNQSILSNLLIQETEEVVPSQKSKPILAIPTASHSEYTQISMPVLSATMKEGKIVSWLKTEGDPVCVGEAIAVVQSDTATASIVKATQDGHIGAIIKDKGSSCAVGDPIVFIATTKQNSISAPWTDSATMSGKAGGNATATVTAAPDNCTDEEDCVATDKQQVESTVGALTSWMSEKELEDPMETLSTMLRHVLGQEQATEQEPTSDQPLPTEKSGEKNSSAEPAKADDPLDAIATIFGGLFGKDRQVGEQPAWEMPTSQRCAPEISVKEQWLLEPKSDMTVMSDMYQSTISEPVENILSRESPSVKASAEPEDVRLEEINSAWLRRKLTSSLCCERAAGEALQVPEPEETMLGPGEAATPRRRVHFSLPVKGGIPSCCHPRLRDHQDGLGAEHGIEIQQRNTS